MAQSQAGHAGPVQASGPITREQAGQGGGLALRTHGLLSAPGAAGSSRSAAPAWWD